MKVAAIDPGTRVVGYCILERSKRRLRVRAMGSIRPKSKPVHKRLEEIHAALKRLFLRHRPAHLVVEKAYLGKNAATAIRLGEARGVVLAAGGAAKLFEYPAVEAKRAVAANGRAAKSAVQRTIQLLLGLKRPPGEDEADAAALAVCHATRELGW